MNEIFQSHVDGMPALFVRLMEAPLLPIKAHTDIPKMVSMFFTKNGEPVYAGRTNRMKDRILEHSRPCSSYNSATFAFLIAKEEAVKLGIDVTMPSKDLVADMRFAEIKRKGRNGFSLTT